MRITGGAARGIPLLTPSDGREVRPATDRMRESLFSFLGDRVEQAVFLDLFAGSGAYGLEAWSRGASRGHLVEKNRSLLPALRQNLKAVSRSMAKPESAVRIEVADALKWKPVEGSAFDLVFCDPPYHLIPSVGAAIFQRVREWLGPDGLLIFEMPGGEDLPENDFALLRRLGKGRHNPTCTVWQLKSGV